MWDICQVLIEIIFRPNQRYHRVLRNLNVRSYPYLLHNLLVVKMQEKCWDCLLICNIL
jgi:hypothetical protein